MCKVKVISTILLSLCLAVLSVTPEAMARMSPALKGHYMQLRNNIYDASLANKPAGNIRFYIAATLHDLSQIKWRQCDEYRYMTGEDCNSAITTELILLVRQITGGVKGLEAVRRVYDYVARNIRYRGEAGNIPQFPYETLVSGIGDCEDQAMLLATLLRIAGFESALVRINDPSQDFYHVFCIVRIEPEWTPTPEWRFDRYASYGHCWKILDPAYSQDFDTLPGWFNKYRAGGRPYIPDEHAEILAIDERDYRRLWEQVEPERAQLPQQQEPQEQYVPRSRPAPAAYQAQAALVQGEDEYIYQFLKREDVALDLGNRYYSEIRMGDLNPGRGAFTHLDNITTAPEVRSINTEQDAAVITFVANINYERGFDEKIYQYFLVARKPDMTWKVVAAHKDVTGELASKYGIEPAEGAWGGGR